MILRVANSGVIDEKKGSFFKMDQKKKQVTLLEPDSREKTETGVVDGEERIWGRSGRALSHSGELLESLSARADRPSQTRFEEFRGSAPYACPNWQQEADSPSKRAAAGPQNNSPSAFGGRTVRPSKSSLF